MKKPPPLQLPPVDTGELYVELDEQAAQLASDLPIISKELGKVVLAGAIAFVTEAGGGEAEIHFRGAQKKVSAAQGQAMLASSIVELSRRFAPPAPKSAAQERKRGEAAKHERRRRRRESKP